MMMRRLSCHAALLWLSLFAVCFSLPSVRAATSPDDQYVRLYSLFSEAEKLSADGKREEALKKYQAAQIELMQFKRAHPTWNSRMVTTRLADLADKINKLSQVPEPATPQSAASAARSAAGPVKLLAPGAEPRQVLRLQPKPGDVQKVGMTMTFDISMEMGAAPAQSIKTPPMDMTVEVTVKSVAENGDIEFESVISEVSMRDDPSVPSQVTDAMKGSVEGVRGISTSGTLSSRAISKHLEVKTSGNVNPQVQQTVDQIKEVLANLTLPLPEEPVGIGARWEVRSPLKSQGITINQVTTQELTAMEGSRVTLSTRVSQTAGRQKITNPGMPSMQMDLEKLTGAGSGTGVMDLVRLLPLSGNSKSHLEMNMSMNAGGQRQTMKMKMDIALELQGK
ncbi:MAG TPA: hypothetical protein VEH04_05250 [Verrucomicrobiae bacterium]|nr:hypothetical protein [Verrucomicrobiae bacterium]